MGELGNDTLFGGNGLDRVFGGAGDDVLLGGEGNDGHFGESGNDTAWGGNGNDRFFGGVGNDILDGEAGQDSLYGGAGFDTITGGTGDDLMAGDYNADRFVFADGHGHDRILDFAATNQFEILDFTQVSNINNFTDAAGALQQIGNDALLTTSTSSSILLLGVDLDDLSVDDFLF